MGPLRGGLILSLLASPLSAEVCDKLRPDWSGTAATAMSEALFLGTSPISLFLFAALVTAVIFRHAMGTALVAMLWGTYISALIWPDKTGIKSAAITEGCVGSPALYIAAVSALCLAAVLFTMRREERL